MTATKRKKLKNMSRTELIAYAKECPGVVLQDKMTKPQIIKAIPWEFRDHDGDETPEDPKAPEDKTEAERLADLEAREAALVEREKDLDAREAGKKPDVPIQKGMTILQAVRLKDNSLTASLRRFISMDGQYRYGLTDEQKAEADKLIKKIGCSKPIKREKKPVETGF